MSLLPASCLLVEFDQLWILGGLSDKGSKPFTYRRFVSSFNCSANSGSASPLAAGSPFTLPLTLLRAAMTFPLPAVVAWIVEPGYVTSGDTAILPIVVGGGNDLQQRVYFNSKSDPAGCQRPLRELHALLSS